MLQNGGACELCPAGKFSALDDNSSCEECLAGKYSSLLGDSNCVECPTGKYASGSGSASLFHCLSCDPGSTSNLDRSDCEICAAGTYAPLSSACLVCPQGKFSDIGGAVSETQVRTGPRSERRRLAQGTKRRRSKKRQCRMNTSFVTRFARHYRCCYRFCIFVAYTVLTSQTHPSLRLASLVAVPVLPRWQV